MDIKHILKDHAYRNIPLSFEEAYELGIYALAGCRGDQLAQIQSITALSALHTKATYAWRATAEDGHHGHRLPENAAEQIAGVCAAVIEHDVAVSRFGFLRPDVPYAMDNCGMGGDLIVTANVSTIAALIAAAAGIPMCKHGSPSNADQGRHGSSDFVTMLGIDTYAAKADIERCLEIEGFAYTEALDERYKLIHSQTHKVAFLPHMNDIIGPITNPLHKSVMTRRVLGVNHLVSPGIVAQVYLILNRRGVTDMRHALIIRGYAEQGREDGMDEVSVCSGGTQVAEIKDGVMREYRLQAADFGLSVAETAEISPPSGLSKGDFSLGILRGRIVGHPLAMVLANAALLFYLAGKSADLKESCALARAVHESGNAYRKALAVRGRLPGPTGR